MEPDPELTHALGTYLEIVDDVAPGLIEGLYVVGSAALGDWRPGHSDVDIVAVTAEPATDDDAGALATAHALLVERQPHPDVDGPYVAWGDLVVEPATGLHRPWALGGRLHHDGECFEISPVTWYTLARYGLVVRGPSPERLGVALDTEARIRFVVDNLRSYWSPLAAQVRAALDTGRRAPADLLEWCALGPLRLHFTAFTGDVTSKAGAGAHGLRVAPAELHPVIDAALVVRATGARGDVDPSLMTDAAALIDWCVADVVAAVAPQR